MFSPKGLSPHLAILVGGDLFLSFASAFVASLRNTPFGGQWVFDSSIAAMLAVVYVSALYFQDLYALERRPRSSYWVAASTVGAAGEVSLVLVVAALALPELQIGASFCVAFIAVSGSALVAWRVFAHYLLLTRFDIGVMALGIGEPGAIMAEEIASRSHLGYNFLGFAMLGEGGVSSRPRPARIDSLPVHTASSVTELTERHPVAIMVVLEQLASIRELARCRVLGVEVLDFHSFYERLTGRLSVALSQDDWLLTAPGLGQSRWRRGCKRAIDLLAVTILGLLALPVMIAAAVAIKLDSKGPVFYSQSRVGIDSKVFRVYKFRSMRQDAEDGTGAVWARKGDLRVTRVGKIIRRLRIDELPQLFNVWKGEMSLIGPRPERPEMVAGFVETLPLYDCRHLVRPGLTGWAQVCYPYGASLEDAREKLSYDLYYVKNWSITLDLQIMFQTTKVVLFGRGAR